MKSSAKNIKLTSVDDLFRTEQEREESNSEKIVCVPLSELHGYKGYPSLLEIMPRTQPYQVRDDDPIMQQMIARVKERGVRQPAIVRPDPEGGYEIIAGHRRYRASELANLQDMPVIIRDMNDEEAAIEVIDSNVQREGVLPSERAWACRMRLEVEKRQGARTDLTSPQSAAKFRSDDEIGKSLGISGDTLRRTASLTDLIQELMDMVDQQRMKLTPAYSLASLTKDEQVMLLDAMDYAQSIPSVSQAQRLKKASQEGSLTPDVMRSILSEEKKSELDKVSFSANSLRKYFPRNYTPKKMEETIIKLLETWQKHRQKDHER